MTFLVVDPSIRLEKLSYRHAFQIFEAIDQNREFLTPWLPFVEQSRTQQDTEDFLYMVLNASGDESDQIYVIWYRDHFAGLLGIKDTDLQNERTEIGYWLIEHMTGKGIVTKSVRTLLSYIFNELKLNRVQIKCGVGNQKSASIPKRLGFCYEGTERNGEKHKRGFIDLEVYSLLRNEWLDKKFHFD